MNLLIFCENKGRPRCEFLSIPQAGNMITRPMQVTQLVKEALDNKFPPLSEARTSNFERPSAPLSASSSGTAILGAEATLSSTAAVA